MTLTLVIDRLGAQGDGVATTPTGQVYIAGALAGETVMVEGQDERAELLAVVTASPDRVNPPCPLFGSCGGCAVQHLAQAPYQAWKRDLVVGNLARAGLHPPVAALIDSHGDGRRRVTLHGRRAGPGIVIGFMQARSHDLVPVAACPILSPSLAEAPKVAADLMRILPGAAKPLTFLITASGTGLDVDLRGQGPVSEQMRLKLTQLADRLDLARLSLHGDVVVERRAPVQMMSGTRVTPPPGGFLQPTRAGEETLVGLVHAALPSARKVIDLFAGSGPFALALARHAEVHAVESEQKALIALDRAARATQGLRRITTEARDLFRRPLLTPEFKPYDAVVLDPPRAGAEAVCAQLARAEIPAIAYVSCDPGTFARDAAILTAGGHALTRVTPVDQFRYSHHVEIVGLFSKTASPRKR